jgi:hypothetical protein
MTKVSIIYLNIVLAAEFFFPRSHAPAWEREAPTLPRRVAMPRQHGHPAVGRHFRPSVPLALPAPGRGRRDSFLTARLPSGLLKHRARAGVLFEPSFP